MCEIPFEKFWILKKMRKKSQTKSHGLPTWRAFLSPPICSDLSEPQKPRSSQPSLAGICADAAGELHLGTVLAGHWTAGHLMERKQTSLQPLAFS